MKKLFVLSLLMLVAVNAPAFGMWKRVARRVGICSQAAQRFVQQRPGVAASMGVGAVGTGIKFYSDSVSCNPQLDKMCSIEDANNLREIWNNSCKEDCRKTTVENFEAFCQYACTFPSELQCFDEALRGQALTVSNGVNTEMIDSYKAAVQRYEEIASKLARMNIARYERFAQWTSQSWLNRILNFFGLYKPRYEYYLTKEELKKYSNLCKQPNGVAVVRDDVPAFCFDFEIPGYMSLCKERDAILNSSGIVAYYCNYREKQLRRGDTTFLGTLSPKQREMFNKMGWD